MITIVFVLYVALMIGVGLVAYRRTHDLSDYLLGGRKMGAFVSAMSAGASDMSGWLLMGLPGAIFVAGLSEAWIGIGLLAGSYLNWLIVARPLRRESERLNALTISDYFEFKFNSRTLRVITAVVILAFFLIYTTSGLVAGGKLFRDVFGLDYTLAVLIETLAVIVYTAVGGFIAVCWTDAIQGVLMLAALLVVPVTALAAAGGFGALLTDVNAVSPHLLTWLRDLQGTPLTLLGFLSTLGWGLGYFGMPHILTRFMGIASEESVPRARRIALVWTALSLAAAILVGLTGIATFNGNLGDGEVVFIQLIQMFFHPIPAGICLAAILAAIMSTADSQLLVCTSVITEDFYKSFYRRDATQTELVTVGRGAVVGIALIAMLLALDQDSKVMGLVSYAWAGFGAAFGPAMILSLYWRRMTAAGAIAGVLVGALTVIAWKNLSGGVFSLYELVPGFVLSAVAIVLVSALSRREVETGG
jgi:sodium/proline symporter